MSEEKMPETVYRELLANTREAIKTVKKMMKSKREDIQVFAVEVFLQTSNLAAALAEALGTAPERDRNPLAHRVRRHDRRGGEGGVYGCLRKTFGFKNGLRDPVGLWTNL